MKSDEERMARTSGPSWAEPEFRVDIRIVNKFKAVIRVVKKGQLRVVIRVV